MPRRTATSAPQLRHAFGSLPHLWHAAALPWSSSAFWEPKCAGGAAADFSATAAERPKVRCGSLWTPSKRARSYSGFPFVMQSRVGCEIFSFAIFLDKMSICLLPLFGHGFMFHDVSL
jgi:hypothetical protein